MSAFLNYCKKVSKTILRYSTNEAKALIIVIVLAYLGLYYGWRLFWFLTDDAFISFRYVSNSILGYGYVWNPPPFKPVEGYTSFLWVLLMDIVWRTIKVLPTESANWISFVFSCFTLAVSIVMCYRIDWNREFKKYRLIFLIIFLFGVLVNRTFLAWTSSGLETAMFNFFLLFWAFSNFYFQPSSKTWLWSVSISTALLYLTRPDGLLFAAAVLIMMSIVLYRKWSQKIFILRDLHAFLPLGVIPVHLMWRKLTYDVWLPNTYFAKSSPNLFWVKSGMYYLLSFIIEYSLWFYLGLIFIFFIYKISPRNVNGSRILPWALETSNLVRLVSVFTLLAHFSYYTFVIGGDHFEYRVYSHLIILIFISSIWIINHISKKPLFAIILLITFVFSSWTIPWSHWYFTRNMTTREDTEAMAISLADTIQRKLPYTPKVVINYLEIYDGLQFWMVDHFVGIRHQEHKVFWQYLVEYYPSREDGSLIDNDGFPVATQHAVGVLSWVLPHVNIIDLLGLNDSVVAQNPNISPRMRMAHFRKPPDGYVDCFSPNVKIQKNRVLLKPRVEPMTADRIVYCESYYLQLVNDMLQK